MAGNRRIPKLASVALSFALACSFLASTRAATPPGDGDPCRWGPIAEDGRCHGAGLFHEDPRTVPGWLPGNPCPPEAALPEAVDNSAWLPPVQDQGNEGSCGAWSLGYYAKTWYEARERGWSADDPAHQFSPAYIYNQVRIPEDNGVWFSDVLELLRTLGSSTLATMPYVDGDIQTWPSEAAFQEALRYRIANYFYIDTVATAGLDQMKGHLAAGNVGLLAIWLYNNFWNISDYKHDYCIANMGTRNYGGHAVTVVGYDDARVTGDGVGAFRCVNSWGTGWGDKGFFWISYQAVADPQRRICQGWYDYFEDIAGQEPTWAARFSIAYDRFRALELKLGYGAPQNPDRSLALYNLGAYADSRTYDQAAPEGPIWVDLGPVMGAIPYEGKIFVSARNLDPANGLSGQIASYSLVRLCDGFTLPCWVVPANIPATGSLTAPSITWASGNIPSLDCTAQSDVASGAPPLTAQFTAAANTIDCRPTTYLWDFGDGSTSPDKTPTHVYPAGGNFTWTCTASAGSLTCTRSGQISVEQACSLTCEATADPSSGSAPLTVVFQGQATAEGCQEAPAFEWDFGDGTGSQGPEPTHLYEKANTYAWALTVTADGVTCSRSGTVTVTAPAQNPGDCDGDGTVSIGELQKAINMFLGTADPACGVDCNGDGVVGIGEVQKVINAFLGLDSSC